MSGTPRTDSVYPPELLERGYLIHGESWGWGEFHKMTSLARTLERELAAEKAKVARLRATLSNIAEGCSFPSDDIQRACRDVARAALKDTDG